MVKSQKPKMSIGSVPGIRENFNIRPKKKSDYKKIKPRHKAKAINSIVNSSYTTNKDIDRLLLIFDEESGEREKHPDPRDMLHYLLKKKRPLLKLSENLFRFGFSIEGKFYSIDSNGIVSSDWGNNFHSLVNKAVTLPKIYYGILLLSTEIWQIYLLTKADFEAHIGELWKDSDRPGSGLYGATERRIRAYVNRNQDTVRFLSELAELKTIYGKLKGLLNTLYMQHQTVNSLLYSTRKRVDFEELSIGNSFMAGAAAEMNKEFTTNVVVPDVHRDRQHGGETTVSDPEDSTVDILDDNILTNYHADSGRYTDHTEEDFSDTSIGEVLLDEDANTLIKMQGKKGKKRKKK